MEGWSVLGAWPGQQGGRRGGGAPRDARHRGRGLGLDAVHRIRLDRSHRRRALRVQRRDARRLAGRQLRDHDALPLDAGLLEPAGAAVALLVEAVAALATVRRLVAVEAAAAVAAPRPLPLLGGVRGVHAVVGHHGGGHVGEWGGGGGGGVLRGEHQLAAHHARAEHGLRRAGQHAHLLLVQLDLLLALGRAEVCGGRVDELLLLHRAAAGGRLVDGDLARRAPVARHQPVPLAAEAREGVLQLVLVA